MDGFKHGVALANVCRARGANAALELGRLIGQDIAVKVGQYHHLELGTAFFIDQLGGHDVNIPVIHFHFRVFLRDGLGGI
ncbi:hypothetical protein SDC9_196424 [bioreactor metagenome]|uniref:Uncharacterized protein n=1 Tax=bioreactor metagenome TaxID=1076179 RepID=A0A645IDB2_9ZZZZ